MILFGITFVMLNLRYTIFINHYKTEIMKLNEVLLKGISFNEILRQFGVDRSSFTIKDEDLLLAKQDIAHGEILKEKIFIQGKSDNAVINFFGTLHYNLLNQLAVFELDYVEKNALAATAA